MIPCLVLGDSIALGVEMFSPKVCVAYAHGGWTSRQWNHAFTNRSLDGETVVISLGTNDHKFVHTAQELAAIRNRIHAKRVVWILPYGNRYPAGGRTIAETDAIVSAVARAHGDAIVSIRHVQRDHIHPSWRGYREIVGEAFP